MLSSLRRFAQTIRHAPGLRSFDPLWTLLREPYIQFLTTLGRKKGITVTVGGCHMQLHPIFASQGWETIETESYRAFLSAVQPDDVIYDVGAHIGTYTLIALLKPEFQGQVVAYEPHDYTRGHLVQHLIWNGVTERAILRDVCCGALPGMADFYCLPGQAEATNGFVPIQGFEKVSVQVTTIDAEVTEMGLIPSIIKIDVEGGEWEVLRGAELTLRQHRPRLFLSLHPTALSTMGLSAEMIFEWLADRGYRCEIIARDHEVHIDAQVA